MRSRLALLATAALAGCFVADAPPTADDAAPLAQADAPPAQPPRPDGRDGGFAAFNETNRTETGAGGLDHAHDYWAGRERVPLLDADAALALCCSTTSPRAAVTLRPPPGALVYEGAAAVEVTLTNPERRACTNVYRGGERVCSDEAGTRAPDPTNAPGVRLFVRDAASKEFRDAGQVTWGTPIVLPITSPKQTDMPHASSTLWGFEVRSNEPRDDTLHFHARIEAVRGPEALIPPWPGHPEFYADAPARVVLQASGATSEAGPVSLVDPAARSIPRLAPDKLVSHGTRTLHVFLNITSLENPNPALRPTEWVLVWHNATGVARGVGGETHGGDVLEHHWVLPVDENGMDSPYADGSRWGFGLFGYFELGAPTPQGHVGLLGCSGLCATYDVQYDVVVIATTEDLPPDAYAVTP